MLLSRNISKPFFNRVMTGQHSIEDWHAEVESRTQGHINNSRPRTQTQVFYQKKVFKKKNCRQSPKKKVFKQIFLANSKIKGVQKHFSGDLQNFNHSKISAVLEPRTGRLSRTWGIKDLTFEVKNFKMCPRGLHLCWHTLGFAYRYLVFLIILGIILCVLC